MDMAVFSLDGKVNIELQGIMQIIWLGDDGEALTLVPGAAQGGAMTFRTRAARKVWSAPNVLTATEFGGKVYYIDSEKPGVIRVKRVRD